MALNWIQVFQALLPNNAKWNLTDDKSITKLFEAIGNVLNNSVEYLLHNYDMDPSTCRLDRLAQMEKAFNMPYADLTEAERRARAKAYQTDVSGLGPGSIEQYLQNMGFDVYIHEWWRYASPPNPNDLEEYFPPNGDGVLIRTAGSNITPHVTACCGEDTFCCGESVAACNGFDYLFSELKTEAIESAQVENPLVPGTYYWPYVIIIGAQTFGTFASVPLRRKNEFIELVRRRVPAHQWVGFLVTFEED
jgi:hypothetical protein